MAGLANVRPRAEPRRVAALGGALCLAAALGACDDDLLPSSRFAWRDPASRAAAFRDAASDTPGSEISGRGPDAAGGGGSDAAVSDTALPDVPFDVLPLRACAEDAECVTLDDGDLCNGVWRCLGPAGARRCVEDPGAAVTCDPAGDTPCTHNVCDPKTGACAPRARADGAACDDGDGCTGGDVCLAGVCSPGVELACECTRDVDCEALDDGDVCNGVMRCDKGALPYKCAVDPATVVKCDPGKGTTCLPWSCDEKTGACGWHAVADGVACAAPGGQCEGALACKGGVCMAEGPSGCEDGNTCTVDGCDPSLGCVFKSLGKDGEGCDLDGDLCGTADACVGGKCVGGGAVQCDDGDPCTADACDAGTGACTYTKKGC